MKTTLWATLTANGNYAQSSAEHPPKPEALGDFAAQVRAAHNFVVGRRTFEGFQAGGGGPAFGDVDIVVVSRRGAARPGVTVVASPADALAWLQRKGHARSLLAGGAELHNAFLAAGLVDELVIDVAPVLEGRGHHLVLDAEAYRYKDVTLLGSSSLGGGVVQLRYAVAR